MQPFHGLVQSLQLLDIQPAFWEKWGQQKAGPTASLHSTGWNWAWDRFPDRNWMSHWAVRAVKEDRNEWTCEPWPSSCLWSSACETAKGFEYFLSLWVLQSVVPKCCSRYKHLWLTLLVEGCSCSWSLPIPKLTGDKRWRKILTDFQPVVYSVSMAACSLSILNNCGKLLLWESHRGLGVPFSLLRTLQELHFPVTV